MHIITPMPDQDWLQSHAYEVYKALNLGTVEVEVLRTDDDALVCVYLPKQKTADGKTAMSVFRFKNGNGIRDSIKRAYRMAAKELEMKIDKQKSTVH